MITPIPNKYLSQKALILFTAVLLSIIACAIFLSSTYKAMQVELADQEQQLFTTRKNIRKANTIRPLLKQQNRQLIRLKRALLTGKNQDAVISTMQIKVQSMLATSGLEPESLRPLITREQKDDDIHSTILKLRLNGTIEQFAAFLTTIYKAESFFHIEGLIIKPFKENQLKIYLDLRGYYQTSSDIKKGKV